MKSIMLASHGEQLVPIGSRVRVQILQFEQDKAARSVGEGQRESKREAGPPSRGGVASNISQMRLSACSPLRAPRVRVTVGVTVNFGPGGVGVGLGLAGIDERCTC